MHSPSLHRMVEMHKTINNITTIRIKLTLRNMWISWSSTSIRDNAFVLVERGVYSVVKSITFVDDALPFSTGNSDVSSVTMVVLVVLWLFQTIFSIQATCSESWTKIWRGGTDLNSVACWDSELDSVAIPITSCLSFNSIDPDAYKALKFNVLNLVVSMTLHYIYLCHRLQHWCNFLFYCGRLPSTIV